MMKVLCPTSSAFLREPVESEAKLLLSSSLSISDASRQHSSQVDQRRKHLTNSSPTPCALCCCKLELAGITGDPDRFTDAAS